jgi:hypothetical protein
VLDDAVQDLAEDRLDRVGLPIAPEREPLFVPPIASASSISEVQTRAKVRVSPGSSLGGSWTAHGTRPV